MEYTKEEYTRFVRLVRMSGSVRQMDRINARLYMCKLVEELGRARCDAMWEVCVSNGDDDPDYL